MTLRLCNSQQLPAPMHCTRPQCLMFTRLKKRRKWFLKTGSWKRKNYTMPVNEEGILTTMEKLIMVFGKATLENSE